MNPNGSFLIRIGVSPGYETDMEKCDMLMRYLHWSYVFVSDDDYGVLNETHSNASAGLVGALIKAAFDFTYPTRGNDQDHSYQPQPVEYRYVQVAPSNSQSSSQFRYSNDHFFIGMMVILMAFAFGILRCVVMRIIANNGHNEKRRTNGRIISNSSQSESMPLSAVAPDLSNVPPNSIILLHSMPPQYPTSESPLADGMSHRPETPPPAYDQLKLSAQNAAQLTQHSDLLK